MSDPISNDYSHVATLSERQSRTAVLETVLRCDRLGLGGAATVELLEMLGIADTAWEVVGRRQPACAPSAGRRDPTGRLRSPRPEPGTDSPSAAVSAPATPVPVPIPAGRHGHNGKCACGDHDWVEENIWATSRGPLCGPCESRRKRRRNERAKQAVGEPPVVVPDVDLKPGEKWCSCEPAHRLTPHNSDTTCVDGNGHMRCRVARQERQRARRRAA